LKYHIVPGKYDKEAIKKLIVKNNGMFPMKTLFGRILTAKLKGDNITLTSEKNGTSNVTTTDLVASNGIVHFVDTVSMPNIVLPLK